MDKEYMSNYEKQSEIWRQKFLTMDQEELCRRLPEIEKREDVLALEHFGRQLAVDRKDGNIRALSDDGPVYVMSKFNVYTLFWYVKEQTRCLTGEWLLTNLISNAYRYGREDGHIMVKAFRRGDKACISVRDNGIGMEQYEVDRIFHRFYQADAARGSREHSLGLGLSMAAEIARLHRAVISVESEKGRGSEFLVIF